VPALITDWIMKPISGADAGDTRFGFGRNWKRFFAVLNDERVRAAEDSLRAMLGVSTLEGASFLDVGSGSGLFSLAAVRLGASRVHSFDYDVDSFECTRELRNRYYSNKLSWTVERGSVLDGRYMRSLGTWDIVYSWGVLHHTGDMYGTFANVVPAVRAGGHLLIAIYNDQGWKSKAWWWVKRSYNANVLVRLAILVIFIPYSIVGGLTADLVRRRNPLARYSAHVRGMSHVHDWVDWLGGFPFEVASRSAIEAHFRAQGFSLERLISCRNKHGCNEFLFKRDARSS
jgi:2-polyprenyl-3-methyl-5-hydroxy-6-metoxy-1,4-benzoquinol methylase